MRRCLLTDVPTHDMRRRGLDVFFPIGIVLEDKATRCENSVLVRPSVRPLV